MTEEALLYILEQHPAQITQLAYELAEKRLAAKLYPARLVPLKEAWDQYKTIL